MSEFGYGFFRRRGGAAPASAPTDVIPSSGTTYFVQDGCSYPISSSATSPTAFYDPVGNKTWHSWEGWNPTTSKRILRASVFNHATGTWVGPYTACKNTLVDDVHGSPAMTMDHEGYVHVFGGSHESVNAEHATTTSPRDPRFWTQNASPYVGSYPHPFCANSQLYVTYRNTALSRLSLKKTTALSGGVPTWGAEKNVAEFNTGRWYQGTHLLIGSEIYMFACQADATDTIRQDVYHIIYHTVTGAVRNADNSVTIASGSQPVSQAQMDASFKLRDQKTGSKQTNVPTATLLSNGNIMVCYLDGAGDGGTYNVNVFTVTPAGVVSADTTVGTTTTADASSSWRSVPMVIADPNSAGARVLWSDGQQSAAMKGSVFDGSSWSAAATFFSRERTFDLAAPHLIKDGKNSQLFGFTETTGDATIEGALRCYAFGFDGTVIKRTTGQTFTPTWPTAPSFTDAGNSLALSTPITSNTVTIAGLSEQTTVSILSSTGGSSYQYRINGGSWQTGTSFISNGDTLQLGVTTAGTQTSGNMVVEFGGWGGPTSTWTWSTVVVGSAETIITTVETRAGSGISATQRAALKTMIQGFIDDGDWATFDHVAMRSLPAQAHALCDFVGTHDDTIVGTLTFTADQGFTGGSASNFLQGTYNPTSHGVNFTRNSMGIGAFVKATPVNGASITFNAGLTGTQFAADLGANSSAAIAGRSNFGVSTARITGTNSSSAANRCVYIVRDSSSNTAFYNNFGAQGTSAQASTGIPNNTYTSHTDGVRLLIELIGGGWTSAAITRISARIATWRTAIGA